MESGEKAEVDGGCRFYNQDAADSKYSTNSE